MVSTNPDAISRQRDARALNDAAHRVPPEVVVSTTSLLRAVDGHRDASPLVARAMRALSRLVATEDIQRDADKSDFGYLLSLLSRPEALAELRRDDPLAPARLRGWMAQERLLHAEGGPLTAQQMADLLGVSRQAIDKRRRAGKLIGVTFGQRKWLYPSWQVGLDGLEVVLEALHGYSAWTKLAFMLSGNTWLDGETPLATLRQGDVAGTAQAARMYGEHVAS